LDEFIAEMFCEVSGRELRFCLCRCRDNLVGKLEVFEVLEMVELNLDCSFDFRFGGFWLKRRAVDFWKQSIWIRNIFDIEK